MLWRDADMDLFEIKLTYKKINPLMQHSTLMWD